MAAMADYNHQVGLKIVGEMMPQERNRVTLADDKDQYGLPIARVDYTLVRQRPGADRSLAPFHDAGVGGDRLPRHLGADRRHLPHEWHGADGRRFAHQRCGYELPELGYSQSLDL